MSVKASELYKRGSLETTNFYYFPNSRFIILEQFDRDCGPTSAEMLLHYYGKWVNQSDISDKGGIHTVHAGTFLGELKGALDGLGVPVDWYHKSEHAQYEIGYQGE